MERLTIITRCEGGSCCCLSARASAAIISIISLVASILDIVSTDSKQACGVARAHVFSLRSLLLTLFLMANTLLLLGSIVENALLLQIYLWYALAFIVIGFAVVILDFLFRFTEEGAWSFVVFLPEVAFLFVIYRCLPLVDNYRKRIDTSQVLDS